MRKLYLVLICVLLVLSQVIFAAVTRPAMIVLPFLQSVTLAANTSLPVSIYVQNTTGVNQTITNLVPIIPAGSPITATLAESTCGFLSPGASCQAMFSLQHLKQAGNGDLNISVCSYNGTLCSKIVKPIAVINLPLQALFITPTNPSIATSTTQQFYAIGLYADQSIQDLTQSVTWSSSNQASSVISNASGSQGLATGNAAGVSTIAATLGTVSESSALTVTTATLSSIIVIPPNAHIEKGTHQQYTATGIFSDHTREDITSLVNWTSANPSIASISNIRGHKGLATGTGVGSTTISASYNAIIGTARITVNASTLSSISVTPSHSQIPKGDRQQYTATGIYSDQTTVDLTQDVVWNTGSALTAIISNLSGSKGLALGVNAGTTPISATFGSVTGSTPLTVTSAILSAVEVSPINQTIAAGNTLQYTAIGIYSDRSEVDVTNSATWLSSHTAIATISDGGGTNGLATGLTPGLTSISATFNGITGSTHLSVNAATLLTLTVTPANPSIPNETEQQFTATGTYSDTSQKDLTDVVTWTSSAPSIAVISDVTGTKGLAFALAAGATSINADFKGVNGNTTLTVTAATLTSIAVTPANGTMLTNSTQPFTATGTYSDLSTKDITRDVTWHSSNTNIATISDAAASKGLATGVSPGSTTISATLNGITGSTSLSVIKGKIGAPLQGGVIACLDGGLNNLIASTADNSGALGWGGSGTVTNAQSQINGGSNTTTIVTVLGAGTTYAAGLCDAYQIDSAGNSPCVGGNTCYSNWFLPAIDQLGCIRGNRNQVGGFTDGNYWSSTENSHNADTTAFTLKFANNGHGPDSTPKTTADPVRCVRLINAAG